jgi:SIR2-like domain
MTACERRNGNTLLARDALARGDLLDAADKLTEAMTPLETATALREGLGFAKSRPHEIHQLLTSLGPERFVTTNFDSLIEQQLGLEGRLGEFRTVTNRQVAELADIQKASANRFIFKPHGDLPASLNLNEISRTHTIVLIIDSLDEMPTEYLDSGQWRSKLELLVSDLQKVCVQFGTRRADLISDSTLPIFLVNSLDERIVKENLEELGRSSDEITSDLFEALKTPFTLVLGRRLLGLNRDIASAPALFSKFLNQALSLMVGGGPTTQIFDRLSGLASSVLASGYDTISIEKAARELASLFGRTARSSKESRRLVDRLVDAGLFVSEIDSHVRFVHRSIAEFFAAIFLMNKWRRKEVKLADILTVRRWDIRN